MKKILFSMFALALLLIPAVAGATEYVTKDDTYTLKSSEVVEDDIYIFTGNATVDGTVKGDLFVFGGNIDISGTVEGDLWVFGGQVNFSGKAMDDFRSGAGNIIISGEVIDDVVVGTGTLVIKEGATIGGDLTAGSGSVSIAGSVNSVLLGVGELTLTDSANVASDITYYSDTDAKVEGGAIYGSIGRKVVESKEKRNASNLFLGSAFVKVGSIVAMFLMLLVILALFPKKSKELTDRFLDNFGMNILWGLVAAVTIPVASIILLISLIFIPFGAFGLLIYPIFLFVARILAIFGLGLYVQNLVNKDKKETHLPIVAMLIGLILVNVFTFIPVIGWFINCILYLAGAGVIAVEIARFLSVRKKRKSL